MNGTSVSRLEKYYLEAKKMIEIKDYTEFMANISKAELLAEDSKEEFAKVSFLKAQGFFRFSQHKRLVDYVAIPLKNCGGEEILKLESYLGVSLAYIGEFNRSRETFLGVMQNVDGNIQLLVETYLNLIWLYFIIDKDHISDERLQEAKEYLDLCKNYIELVPDNFKWKIYNGYSIYFYQLKDYENALEILKEASKYCEEKNLSFIYGNFAEIYLKFENEDVSSVIKEFTQKAEVLASKYNDSLGMARAFYIQAMSEIKADQFFTALDTLYMAFEHFKKAEAYPLAFDCLVKINELMSDYKVDRLKALKESVRTDFKDTPFYAKI